MVVLALGIIAFMVPTIIGIAKASWSTEQGGHGPMVLAVALWLIARDLKTVRAMAQPGSAVLTAVLLVPLLLIFTFARITSIIEIEALAMYGALLVITYQFIGWPAMKRLWFPFVFLLFAVPPPDTLYAMITQPLKIAISAWSVDLLYLFGYPVASSGVVIQIGQYQLLVAAACAGINSLQSLTALGLFYSYIRHQSEPGHMLFLALFIFPIAVAVNLVRVLLLMVITYHFGDAAGQGWFHEFAGLTMFVLALTAVYLLDSLMVAARSRFGRKVAG